MKRLKKLAILATVAAAALLVATVAFGAAPGDDGKVLACSVKYGPHKGEVRFMDSNTATCHTSERPVTLATAASIPTPQPAPKTTTEFAVIVTGGGAPTVQASSEGVSVSQVQPNRLAVNFGHSLAQCSLAGSGNSDRPNVTIWVEPQTGLALIQDPNEHTRLVAVCNA